MSGSDYANSSLNQNNLSYMGNAYTEQYCPRENFNLQNALSEVFMDSKTEQYEVKRLKRM